MPPSRKTTSDSHRAGGLGTSSVIAAEVRGSPPAVPAVDGAPYDGGPLAPQLVDETCWDWVDEVLDRYGGKR